MSPKISFKIKESYGKFPSEDFPEENYELTLTSWRNITEKFDLRIWNSRHTHSRRGLRFTLQELQDLRDLLNQQDFEKLAKSWKKAHKKRSGDIL